MPGCLPLIRSLRARQGTFLYAKCGTRGVASWYPDFRGGSVRLTRRVRVPVRAERSWARCASGSVARQANCLTTEGSRRAMVQAVRCRAGAVRRAGLRQRRHRRFGKAGVSLVIAAPLLAAACTSSASSAPGSPPDSSQLSGAAVYRFLPATGAQLAAGVGFFHAQNVLRNVITDRCMAGFGFGSSAQPFVTYFEKYINPPQGSPLVPGWGGENDSNVPNLYDLPPLAHGGLLAPVRTGSPNPTIPAAELQAIRADFQRCQYRSWRPFQPLFHAGWTLSVLWQHQAAAVEATGPVQAAYAAFGSCVRRRGAPTKAAGSPDSYSYWLTALVAPSIPDPYGQTTLIAGEVKLDRRWTTVFTGCLGPVLRVQDPLLLKAQAAFLQAHYQQVLAVQRLADHAVSSVDRRYHVRTASS